MRRLFAIVLAIFAVAVVQATEPEGAKIALATQLIDLGELSQKAPKQRVDVEYTNMGDLPLVVLEVRTSCTCTTTRYERKKVMPGEKGIITIEMEPKKAPEGSFYRVLQVLSTAKDGPANIVLKAEITK